MGTPRLLPSSRLQPEETTKSRRTNVLSIRPSKVSETTDMDRESKLRKK